MLAVGRREQCVGKGDHLFMSYADNLASSCLRKGPLVIRDFWLQLSPTELLLVAGGTRNQGEANAQLLDRDVTGVERGEKVRAVGLNEIPDLQCGRSGPGAPFERPGVGALVEGLAQYRDTAQP